MGFFRSKMKRPSGWRLSIGIMCFSFAASAAMVYAAVQSFPFTTADNYAFDASKIEVVEGVAQLKPFKVAHKTEDDFSGTYTETVWKTDHIQLDGSGLEAGVGVYISPVIDSSVPAAEWGKLNWNETLSQGKAAFAPKRSAGESSTGTSVYAADLDGDDDVDLASVQGKSPRTIYLENDGAQQFSPRAVSNGQPRDARDVDVADVNSDGRPDLIVIAKANLVWFENLGGAVPTWKRRSISPSPVKGTELDVADVDGDGILDVVIGDGGTVKWYQNDGANPPKWTVHEVDAAFSNVGALATGDLDGDGDVDLLAGDGGGLYWLENNGADIPGFARHVIDSTLVNVASVLAADFNGDGTMDVAAAGLSSTSVSWYENNGAIPVGFTKRSVDSGPVFLPFSIAAGDLDRDGDLDLVLADKGNLYWYENQGGVPLVWKKATLGNGGLLEADHLFLGNLENQVNGDDDLDIVLAEKTQVSWWENLLPHSNIRFQLRTSEDGKEWSSWQGPGGRTSSFYSEGGGEYVTVPNGRYIQYRAMLSTHEGTTLNPQLSEVQLELASTRYRTDSPTVQNNTGLEFSSLSGFAESLGAGHAGEVRYQISNDGAMWYYHNGSIWVPAAQDNNHTNSAAEVNDHVSTFAEDAGAGLFYFKAFLISDGSQQVVLDRVEVNVGAGAGEGGSGSGSADTEGESGRDPGDIVSGNNAGSGAPINFAWLTGSRTTDGTNINQTPGVALEWSAGLLDDFYFNHSDVNSPEKLYVKSAGDYLVALTLPMSGAVARSSVQAEIKVNGVAREGAIGDSSYIRNTSGHTESSDHIAFLLTGLSVNDAIEVYVSQKAAAGTVNIDGQASLYVEYVSPKRNVFSAVATAASQSSNLNQKTSYPLRWTGIRSDAAFFHSDTIDSERIAVNQSGDYLAFVNVPLTGAVTRGNVKLLVRRDGSTVPGGEGKQGYIRNANDHNASSVHWSGVISNLEAGSVLTFETQQEAGTGTVSIPAGNAASLYLERLDTSKQVYFARGKTLTGGDNWNPAAPQSIEWKVDDIIDPAFFGHSTTAVPHEIIVKRDGDYLLAYNDSLSSSGTRPNVRITVEVNGTPQTGAETKSHYIRSASGHNESSGSLVYLLDNLKANDVISVSAAREAGSASVNDDDDALLMLWFKDDVTAPALVSATVSNGTMVLTYNDANNLDITTIPDPSDFSVGTDGVEQHVTRVNVSADKVTLTLSPGVADSDRVTLNYTAAIHPIQDRAGNSAPDLMHQPVSNDTPMLVFAMQPEAGTSGSGFIQQPVVEIMDSASNVITEDPDGGGIETVTLSLKGSTNEDRGTLYGTATAPVDWRTGHATFSDLWIDKAGNYQLVATTNFLSSTAESAAFTVVPGPPSQLQFTVEPVGSTSLVPLAPAVRVQVLDTYGNLVGKAAATIALILDSNPGNGTLSGTLTAPAVSGIATFDDIAIDKAASGYTLVASASGMKPATSVGFDVAPGPAVGLAYGVEPSNVVSSRPITPTIQVRVEDTAGNLVTTAEDSVTVEMGNNPGNGKLAGTVTEPAVAGIAAFHDIAIDKKGEGYTLYATATGLNSAESRIFNVVASDEPIRLAFDIQPTNTANGSIVSLVTVEIEDAAGNHIESATGPVTLGLSDNTMLATLSGNLTVAAMAGKATFTNMSIQGRSGPYRLVASSPGLNAATSASFNLTPGPPETLAFSVEPVDAESGQPVVPAVTVQIKDASGNRVDTAANPVTVKLSDNPSGAALSGALVKSAVGGEAVFSDLTIDKAGSGFQLTAIAPGLPPVHSRFFDVSAGPAAQLVFSVEPSTSETNVSIDPAVEVQILDGAGNAVLSNTVVALSLGTRPAGAMLQGTLEAPAVQGRAVFNDISLSLPGTGFTLVASAPGLLSTSSASFEVLPTQERFNSEKQKILIPYRMGDLEANVDSSTDNSIPKETTEEDPLTPATVSSVQPPEAQRESPPEPPRPLPTFQGDTAVGEQPVAGAEDLRSGLLNRESALTGRSVTIRYRTASGLSPQIDVYDSANIRRVAASRMKEVGSSGVYEYRLRIRPGWAPGDLSVIVSEQIHGTLSWMTLTLSPAATDQNSRVITNREISVPTLLEAAANRLQSIDALLKEPAHYSPGTESTDQSPSHVESQEQDIARLQSSLREITRMLKPVSSQNGIDLKVMYESIEENSSNVEQLREKAEQLKLLLEINREILEKPQRESRAPITKTWYQKGSVILKILVVNPSQTETQTVPVKIYLPKEITPDHILDVQDLQLDYDEDKKLYFAHEDVELKPGESITKMVRMEDIWKLDREMLDGLLDDAKGIAARLKESSFREEADAFVSAIASKVQEILDLQAKTSSNAGEHIQAYREGSEIIDSIKGDLAALQGYEKRAMSEAEESVDQPSGESRSKTETDSEKISVDEQEPVEEEP